MRKDAVVMKISGYRRARRKALAMCDRYLIIEENILCIEIYWLI